MGLGLHISVDEQDNKKIIRIEGRLDATSSPLLEKKISELIDAESRLLVIDFSKIDYLSSAGMRLMLAATKRLKTLGGKIAFFGMADEVLEIVKMAGFERILPIYPDEKTALEKL